MTAERPTSLGSLGALAALGVAVPAFYREAVLAAPLEPAVAVTARVTHWLIGLAGMSAELDDATISAPGGFAYEVYFRCTGFLPVICVAVAILAHPAPWRRRLAGLAVGVPVLLGLNFVRLVHLFQLGVSRPEVFDVAHSVVWEAAIVVAVASVFLGYLAWCEPAAGGGDRRAALAQVAAAARR